MKKTIFILLYIFSFSFIYAQQNIVPNFSFEDKLRCPGQDDFNGFVADWTGQGSYSTGGLNYFTANCSTPALSVPSNEMGYQNAHTGVSYAGITTYLSQYSFNPNNYDYRSYIQVMLNNPLIEGVRYCVVWYVSLSDTSMYECSDMGAYFSDSMVHYSNRNAVKSNLIPQIANDPVNNSLTDKKNWTKITGSFISAGGEHYIIIGNFKDDAHSYIDSIGSNAPPVALQLACAAFYYIDDVSVLEVMQAHAGKDTLICNRGEALIGRDTAIPGVSYHWLPTVGLSNPNAAQTYASPTRTTTYTLMVINDSMKRCGCPDSLTTDSVTVEVCIDSNKNDSETTVENNNVFVPTAFSPNGSANNILYVRCDCIASMDFNIFDRWGNKVFESQYSNKGWDGTHNGKPMDMGTYIWELKANLQDGTEIRRRGDVTLLR